MKETGQKMMWKHKRKGTKERGKTKEIIVSMNIKIKTKVIIFKMAGKVNCKIKVRKR